jgi:hypothetical protein
MNCSAWHKVEEWFEACFDEFYFRAEIKMVRLNRCGRNSMYVVVIKQLVENGKTSI